MDDKERLPSDERVLLADVAVLEALLQEYADEHGPDFSQKALLGEASLPQNLLGQLREARRDLAILRQNSLLAELVKAVGEHREIQGGVPDQVAARVKEIIEDHVEKAVLSVDEAASMMGLAPKTLRNRISEARRAGSEFDWVLRAGRRKGCAVHRDKFLRWLERQPRRRGRPPGS